MRVARSRRNRPREVQQLPEFDIEALSLTKQYGGRTVVRGLNLRVNRGTIFGFLGPNGAGKSTTLKMLTGILKPTSGEVRITGASLAREPVAVKQRIGVLPESLALFDGLTVREHLTLCGRVYELDRSEARRRADELLRFLDLWEARDVHVEQASYGMRKKCALAMALLHNPPVLFLDEPFEGIDPIARSDIEELLRVLAKRGVTIFLTSHILEIVEKLVDEFAIIVGGEIVSRRSVAELEQAGESLRDTYFRFVGRERTEELTWLG